MMLEPDNDDVLVGLILLLLLAACLYATARVSWDLATWVVS